MKTRTKKLAAGSAEDTETTKSVTQIARLAPDEPNPPQLLVLPKSISKYARIVTLPNPRDNSESRYIICPECGIYEFTKASAPKTTPRSWLLSAPELQSEDVPKLADSAITGQEAVVSDGYITKSADIFVATLVDPVFFVLPVLVPSQSSKSSTEKRLFLSSEDYFDRIGADSSTFRFLLRRRGLRELLETRMSAVCDTVEAGDETMYRISEKKLLEEIMTKASKMVEDRLPASMEEKFIKKPLEAPMLSIQRDASFHHQLAKEEEEALSSRSGASTPMAETADSQSSVSTSATSLSDTVTAATSFASDSPKVQQTPESTSAPEGIAALLRLRTAFSFICSCYLPPHLTIFLKSLLSETSPTLFAPLDDYLAHISKLRQEAVAARSLGDLSRKRSLLDDEEEEARAEKKRKKEEDEKRKKSGESRAVKNLKKVNTTGMKKMSAFFTKKA